MLVGTWWSLVSPLHEWEQGMCRVLGLPITEHWACRRWEGSLIDLLII